MPGEPDLPLFVMCKTGRVLYAMLEEVGDEERPPDQKVYVGMSLGMHLKMCVPCKAAVDAMKQSDP